MSGVPGVQRQVPSQLQLSPFLPIPLLLLDLEDLSNEGCVECDMFLNLISHKPKPT